MSEARSLSGMAAREVLRRLLRLRRDPSADDELRDGASEADSPESLLLGLDLRGMGSRLVRRAEGELRYLEMPAPVQKEDGTWLLLRERRGSRFIVEGAAE